MELGPRYPYVCPLFVRDTMVLVVLRSPRVPTRDLRRGVAETRSERGSLSFIPSPWSFQILFTVYNRRRRVTDEVLSFSLVTKENRQLTGVDRDCK